MPFDTSTAEGDTPMPETQTNGDAAVNAQDRKINTLGAKLLRVDRRQKKAQAEVERLTDERIATILELREQGATFPRIGAFIGVSGQAIYEILNRAKARQKNANASV